MKAANSVSAALLAAVAFFGSPGLRAEVRGLTLWQPEENGPRLVIPLVREIDTKSFLQRYIASLNADPGYRALGGNIPILLPAKGFSSLSEAPGFASRAPEEFLVIANRPGHMLRDDPFLRSVLTSLTAAGANPLIVPVGLENALEPRELVQFHERLVARFPALMSIGGGDIHPGIYGREITYARAVNRKRDEVEVSLIRQFTKGSRGMFYGICRGAQLGAATLGFELIQDVPMEVPDSGEHAVGSEGAQDSAHSSAWHEVEIVPGSFLAKAVGTTRMLVNSRHHQAVLPTASRAARITARAPDGTVEAIEFTNGRGVLFQFHPEDMGTVDARRIMEALVSRVRELRLTSESAPYCELLLRNRR